MNIVNTGCVLGIDAGTTSVKGVLLDSGGNVKASATQEYCLESGPGDICELQPETYWEMTCKVIHTILDKSDVDPDLVKGLAFSSQGETLITVDSSGNPLRKAIVWLDNRSKDEAKKIEEHFGNQHIMNVTGQPEVVPAWPATRILWLKIHEPHIHTVISKYLLVEDYLMFRMTGNYYTEYSMASSTLYFDIEKKTWWNEMIDFLEISPEQLPQLMPSGKWVGHLTTEAAKATGLTIKTAVYTGAYDHAAGAIGSGNIAPGMASLTIGASMAMCMTVEKKQTDLSLRLPCQCHPIHDLFFLLPFAQTAGLVLKWFRDEFCREEIESARKLHKDSYAILDSLAEQIAPGSDGLIMLPHLMGTGSPEFNPGAKAVFEGITLGMTKAHFIRAILEAIAANIERNLELLKQHGIEINEIHMLGGGSRNTLWNQIIADMTGIPVITLKQSENASIGAAILAAVGAGLFRDINEAYKTCILTDNKFSPNPDHFSVYRKVYQRYVRLYNCLENYWTD